MKLSVVIPAHNEEGQISSIVNKIYVELKNKHISHEILVINDNSSDNTKQILQQLSKKISSLKFITKSAPNGFGLAVKKGLENFKGEYVVIMMADESDSVKDLIAYYKELENGNDCVFGSRFIKGSKIVNYPKFKLLFNRLTNYFIKTMFHLKTNDITNAFKGYHKNVIKTIQPFISDGFELTAEIPLKAIINGFSYKIIPISWKNRKKGVSKLRILKEGKNYIRIILKLKFNS